MASRQTRAAASKMLLGTTTIATHAPTTNAMPLNDQYFASPKRKDSKLDTNSVPSPTNDRLLLNSIMASPPPSVHTTTVNGKRNHKNSAASAKVKKQTGVITNFFYANGTANEDIVDAKKSAVASSTVQQGEIYVNINGDSSEFPALPTAEMRQKKKLLSKIDQTNDLKAVAVHIKDSMNDSNPLTSPGPAIRNGVKQTTPHRIFCRQSPTKKQRLYAKHTVEVFSNLNIDGGSSRTKAIGGRATTNGAANKREQQRSRRKFNICEAENYRSNANVITIDDDDNDEDGDEDSAGIVPLNNGVSSSRDHNTLKSKTIAPKITKKPILNSTVDPTAHENTTNNSKGFAVPTTGAPRRVHDTQLTDFFPIRRSVRKTKKAVEQEQSRYIEMAIEKQLEDGLVVKTFAEKGRGIVAGRPFIRGEFVVEYIGELIDQAEADHREEIYAKNVDFGCYMYYFKHKEQQWCIDATAETGKLGRLVNHSRNGNLATKIVSYKNLPHLVLLAKDDIKEGEELTYDYGDRRREALIHHPWLAF